MYCEVNISLYCVLYIVVKAYGGANNAMQMKAFTWLFLYVHDFAGYTFKMIPFFVCFVRLLLLFYILFNPNIYRWRI